MMLQIIGWVGAISFAICSFPQVYKTWRTKSLGDFSWWFLWLWFMGEVPTWIYLMMDNYRTSNWQWPLHFNYAMNALGLSYLLWAKWAYRVEKPKTYAVLQSTPSGSAPFFEAYLRGMIPGLFTDLGYNHRGAAYGDLVKALQEIVPSRWKDGEEALRQALAENDLTKDLSPAFVDMLLSRIRSNFLTANATSLVKPIAR
jgi:uncharacterized protein with PQ loop repeat